MITLATLPHATAQEVFDQVATHLLIQNQQSKKDLNSSVCLYRGEKNLKCAAGCLIADTEYLSVMDSKNNTNWSNLVTNNLVPKEHEDLINRLQTVHDRSEPTNWKKDLKELAEELNLKFSEEN